MKHYIIPVFIPHYGCTHACVFCNQQKITGQTVPVSAQEVTGIIEEHLVRITEKRHIEVAFYGGSFTALDLKVQQDLLTPAYEALQCGKIHAIRLSTRPDCITEGIVQNLINFGVSTIELGVQSLDDKVLEASARGHSSGAVVQAVAVIKKMGLSCGIQVMPGLPGEDWASLISTAQGIVQLAPDFVRVYPTLVIANTQLATMYNDGRYDALPISGGVSRAAYLKILFAQYHIPVIRTGLQATEDLGNPEIVLAGPYHPAFGEMVDSYLFYLMVAHFAESVILEKNSKILVHHHTRDTSKLRGMSNCNIKKLQRIYNMDQLVLKADGLKLDEVLIEYQNLSYIINKKMIYCI
ncbi:elongator complex protein 3 [Pelosinus sp. sgz500959]|uniref:elongator complex protein 3 n=1 Tax=Pelosinus sp. sgz500959 TaxID=3242472 RepID=UPI0036706FD6